MAKKLRARVTNNEDMACTPCRGHGTLGNRCVGGLHLTVVVPRCKASFGDLVCKAKKTTGRQVSRGRREARH